MCWKGLAAHVSVKCGVTIGRGCLVAANSAVTKDLPDGVRAGGVPAKVIGTNEDGEAEFQDRLEMQRGRLGEEERGRLGEGETNG